MNIFTPEAYGAQGDTRKISAIVTASGNSISATAAIFQPSDVGKYATIGGCGWQVADTCTIDTPGTGYVDYNQLTVSGGTGTETGLIVVNVGPGGAVNFFNQFYRLGKYSAIPPNPVSTTGGSGSGAKFNLTWRSLAHTSLISAVATDGKSCTLATPVIFNVTSSSQIVYIGSDDGGAVQSCLSAAASMAAFAPACVQLSSFYTVLDRQVAFPVIPRTQPISINSVPGAGFHIAQQTGNKWGVVVNPGESVLVGSGAVTANAVKGAEFIQVNPSVVAGCTVDDYLYLNSQTSTGQGRAHIFRVKRIDGNNVHMSHALPFSLDHNQPNFINKINPVENLTISDVTFDGFGTITDYCVGLAFFQTAYSRIRDCFFKNFFSYNSQGFASYEGYRNDLDIKAEKCGGGTGADGIVFGLQSLGRLKGDVGLSYGLGIGCTLVSDSFLNLTANDSRGRMIKLSGSCANRGFASCSNAQPGFTGLSFTNASSDNLLFAVQASNCSEGIWSDGSGNVRNTVSAYSFSNNSVADIALGGPNDSKFDIYCCPSPAPKVVFDGSVGSSIRQSVT